MAKYQIVLNLADVEYDHSYEESHVPIHGNAMASGDDEFDKECENDILGSLQRGDTHAWCDILVNARLGHYVGTDSLCAVSVQKAEEIEGVIEENGMRDNALAVLVKVIEAAGGKLL